MAIRILSGENITGDITTSGKVNAGDRILTEATTSNALLQVKYNASNYLEAYYDTLNVVGGDFLIKRAGDTKIRLTAVGTTFTNLSNTSAASSSVDEVKIGTFGAGRPAIFLGTSNTTYTNSTWFIENIGASGKFRIGRNGLDILEIENSGASTFKATSVTVLNASDPSLTVSDTDTNYRGTMRFNTTSNVLEFVTRYASTYYTKNLVLDRGKVGIGTYTPETDLMIYDTVNEDPAEPGFATTGMFALNRSGQATLSMGVGANNSFWMSNVNRAFTGPNYYNISLNPLGGRVGIGTTSPGYKLQVSGVQNENDIVINNTATGINLRMQANNASANIFTTGALDLTLGTNNSTNVTVKNGGNVGIGTTTINNPFASEAALQVGNTSVSGNDSLITIASGTTGSGDIYFADGNSGGLQYRGFISYKHNGDYLAFGTNETTRMIIQANGTIYSYNTNNNTWYGNDAGLGLITSTGANNVMLGYKAGELITTGSRNTIIGSSAAKSLAASAIQYSVVIGFNALAYATNDSNSNVVIGDAAMSASTGAAGVVAIGQAAANSLTGNDNTVIGYGAYYGATTGVKGVIIGYQTGNAANAIGHVMIGWRAGYVNQANSNVYIGQEAGRNNTSGASNVFIGVDAGYANVTGASNTFVGTQAGTYHTGGQNTSFGHKSLFGVSNASSGSYNTAVGFYAGYGNKGTNNTCLGAIAGRYMLTGEQNTIVGSQASDNNDITGNENVVLGFATAQKLTSGSENTVLGSGAALVGPITGSNNVFVGRRAAYSMGSAAANTIIGHQAGYYLSSGSQNTGVGKGALTNVTSGTNHTTLGYTAGDEITTGTNCIAIGFAAGSGSSPRQMTTNSNEIVIGSNAIVGAYVRVAWTTGSDKRDKINFSNVPHGLDFVNKLKPTSYSLRKERDSDEIIGKRKYGFLAQEILELEGENPVIIDNSDENKLALQDSNLIPILVNAIQELKAEIELLKNK